MPLPEQMCTRGGDGSVTEHIYISEEGDNWVVTRRDFATCQRKLLGLEDKVHLPSLDPLWCSWTDWKSSDIDEKLILEQARQGLELGIRNFILDDGWFGEGLDTEEKPNQLGDYTPDTARFLDLAGLSRDICDLGGRLILWVGPHCVAKGTQAERGID